MADIVYFQNTHVATSGSESELGTPEKGIINPYQEPVEQ